MSVLPAGKKMGLFMATVLVVVNMVGTGIFLLPVSMASVGSISIFGWVVATIGATAIGLMFALLGSVDPQAGGPYAYARSTFGPYLGFQTNYVYWSANLVGNIAVAATVTGYFTTFVPALAHPAVGATFTIGVIWLATGVNLAGPRLVGFITSWSTVAAMIPLTAIALFGWFWFDAAVFFSEWKTTDDSSFDAISKSASFALWAFMGIESAAVSADVIENPKRNVPLATMLGLVIAAVLYVLTCTVLMGIIPANELAKSPAPFVTAAEKAIGPAGAVAIALCAIFKAGSSLMGWTLTICQSSLAAAKDGLFPRVYGVIDGRGIPVWNLVISGVLMSLIVVATISPSLTQQFDEIIDMAIVLTILPYLYTAVAFLKINRRADTTSAKRTAVIVVAITASLYCLWVVGGSDANLTRDAMVVLLLSVPLYPLFQRRLESAG